ncbi:MAG: hypothetical protein ACYDEZ_07920 [Methanoregula sp.]
MKDNKDMPGDRPSRWRQHKSCAVIVLWLVLQLFSGIGSPGAAADTGGARVHGAYRRVYYRVCSGLYPAGTAWRRPCRTRRRDLKFFPSSGMHPGVSLEGSIKIRAAYPELLCKK